MEVPMKVLFFISVFVSFAIRPLRAEPTSILAGENVVRNGSFESESAWTYSVNGANASGKYIADQHHTGAQAYRLTNKSGFAPHVYARVYQTITGLMPFTTYRISCFVKGQKSGIAWIGGGPG